MDRTHKAQLGRMELLKKIRQASQKGKDAAKNIARAKAQAKFREEVIERILESAVHRSPSVEVLRKGSEKVGKWFKDYRLNQRIKKLEKNQKSGS